jgi:SHS2 domain-containing protein
VSFRLRSHTADVAVEATADTLGGVMAAVADGMAAAMADQVPDGGDRRSLEVSAEGREALLFDYLDELIYERDVRSVLPVDNEARVTPPGPDADSGPDAGGTWTLEGSYRGVPLAGLGARDLKAVTYSEMELTETDEGWHAYVVFDV